MIQSNSIFAIAVYPVTGDQHNQAYSLAAALEIPVTLKESEKFRYLLVCSSAGIAIKQTSPKSPGPFMVNFTDSKMAYRLKHGGGRTQALARAIGLKRGWQPTVIDATAGLGRDAFVLAHLGCSVHMLERSPILAVMLEDGLQRAAKDTNTAEAAERIHLTEADSKVFLEKLPRKEQPDVIYLDPMFPERTKSSLVKKEMRILRQLAGSDPDAEELLHIALQSAGKRVVVKRPRLAPILGGRIPSHAIKGKTSRFDVYLV